jgi:hypothetical protein
LPIWRTYVLSSVISCVVAAATALVTVRLASPAPGPDPRSAGGGVRQADATVVLEGVPEVPCAKSREEPAEVEVFDKAAFAAPPHLTFPEGLTDGCQVADQKAGGFKLRRIETSGRVSSSVKWRAEGEPSK